LVHHPVFADLQNDVIDTPYLAPHWPSILASLNTTFFFKSVCPATWMDKDHWILVYHVSMCGRRKHPTGVGHKLHETFECILFPFVFIRNQNQKYFIKVSHTNARHIIICKRTVYSVFTSLAKLFVKSKDLFEDYLIKSNDCGFKKGKFVSLPSTCTTSPYNVFTTCEKGCGVIGQ
jgi:hypothetical protein